MEKFTRSTLALCLTFALCLTLALAPAAFAEASSTSLFGYVIDMSGNTIELMTDDETPYTFTRDDATHVASIMGNDVNIDDAIMLKYEGTLNQSAVQQSVRVVQIDVLTVMYGIITDASMNTITVLSDDDGGSYTFGIDDADVVNEAGSILVNDQVELSFSGQLGAPDAGSAIIPQYLHVTVYGQAEDDVE